jgi:hypothetical protein
VQEGSRSWCWRAHAIGDQYIEGGAAPQLHPLYSSPNHPVWDAAQDQADMELAEAVEQKLRRTGRLRAHPIATLS